MFYIESHKFPLLAETVNQPYVQVVALGKITRKLPARWTTADGKVPAAFKGREEDTFGTGIFLATPVIVEVKEYWKNPQASRTLLVRSAGGRDGDYEVQHRPPPLRDYLIGAEFVLFLDAPEPYADLGPAWVEVGYLPIREGEVGGRSECLPANVPIGPEPGMSVEELKARVLAAMAAGTPYRADPCPGVQQPRPSR